MLCELLSLRCICVYQYGRAWHLLQIEPTRLPLHLRLIRSWESRSEQAQ